MSATLAGIKAQITVPTDVAEFIHAARADYSGSDYPGALELGHALAAILKAEGATPRELRLFAAQYVVALEDYNQESSAAQQAIMGRLANVDFKQYWS